MINCKLSTGNYLCSPARRENLELFCTRKTYPGYLFVIPSNEGIQRHLFCSVGFLLSDWGDKCARMTRQWFRWEKIEYVLFSHDCLSISLWYPF